MQPHEFDAFTGMVSGVADALGKPVPSEHGLVIWWNALKHYDLSAIADVHFDFVGNLDRFISDS